MIRKVFLKNRKTEDKSVSSLASVIGKKRRFIIAASDSTIKPFNRKWGSNYIEIQPMSSTSPLLYDVPADFKTHKTSPHLHRIAKVLVKIHVAGINRLGRDILEEY